MITGRSDDFVYMVVEDKVFGLLRTEDDVGLVVGRYNKGTAVSEEEAEQYFLIHLNTLKKEKDNEKE